MPQMTLSRQFIRDAEGRPIAVILPIEEYALIEPILEGHDQNEARKIQEIELAANAPLFLADLEETTAAFGATDTEWWQRARTGRSSALLAFRYCCEILISTHSLQVLDRVAGLTSLSFCIYCTWESRLGDARGSERLFLPAGQL